MAAAEVIDMLETILKTLEIMGWLGIILAILAFVNILTGTLTNVWCKGQKFDLKRLLQSIGKVFAFYLCTALVGIAFTLLPSVNNMINNVFNVALLSDEILNTFSSVAIFTEIVSVLVVQAKKAYNSIINLATVTFDINKNSGK